MSTPMNSDQSPIAAGTASPEGFASMIESMRCALFGEESPFFTSLCPRVEYSTADNAELSQTKRRIFPELSPSEHNVQESTPAPLPVAATTPPAVILSPQGAVASAPGAISSTAAQGEVASAAAQEAVASTAAQPGAVASTAAQGEVASAATQGAVTSAATQPGAVASTATTPPTGILSLQGVVAFAEAVATPPTSILSPQEGVASTAAAFAATRSGAASVPAQPEVVASVASQPEAASVSFHPGATSVPGQPRAASVPAQPGVVASVASQPGAALVSFHPGATSVPGQPGAASVPAQHRVVAFATAQPGAASVSFHPGAASAPGQTGVASTFSGKRPRGRPVGSKNKQKSKPQPKPITVDGAREIVSGSAISRFTPHEFFVKAGEGGNLLGTAVSTNSEEHAKSHTKPVITLTGAAEKCAIGPPLGLVDIGESENAYLFRVALPGVRHKCNIKCDIQREGRVRIEGVVAESEVLKKSPKGYEMKVQQLSPPGPFTVSFSLPGPVDPRLCSPHFRADGILEVIVMKYRIPLVSAEGLPENWYNGSFPDP